MIDPSIRPLLFSRVVFDIEDPSRGWHRGAMGGWVKSVFEAERVALLDELEKARETGLPKDRVTELRREARFVADTLADIDRDLLIPAGARRMRIFRGGHDEWIQGVLRDEQADLYDDLAQLREDGKPESDPEVMEVILQLQWSVAILRDIDVVRISLQGPDNDPR